MNLKINKKFTEKPKKKAKIKILITKRIILKF